MSIQCATFTRVLRLRLKDKHARALREHAYWVNQVWNYCNELSFKVLQRERRFLSGFDLQKYTAGATREGLPLHSQSVQAIAEEYALRRKQAGGPRFFANGYIDEVRITKGVARYTANFVPPVAPFPGP